MLTLDPGSVSPCAMLRWRWDCVVGTGPVSIDAVGSLASDA